MHICDSSPFFSSTSTDLPEQPPRRAAGAILVVSHSIGMGEGAESSGKVRRGEERLDSRAQYATSAQYPAEAYTPRTIRVASRRLLSSPEPCTRPLIHKHKNSLGCPPLHHESALQSADTQPVVREEGGWCRQADRGIGVRGRGPCHTRTIEHKAARNRRTRIRTN